MWGFNFTCAEMNKYMKKILVLIVLIWSFLPESKAQTGKGSFMVGGSMSLQREDRNSTLVVYNYYPQGSFTLTPTVGYFVIDNLMIGVQPTFGYTWTFNSKYKSTSVGAGPVIRYYFPVGKFSIFPELTASFRAQTFTSQVFNPDTGSFDAWVTNKLNQTQFRGGVGCSWFPFSNIGIEGILSYRSSKYSSDLFGPEKQSQYGFTFGIQFYFPKKD